MRKATAENKSLSSIKTLKKKFEKNLRSKLDGALKVSKVFIMNSGLQPISMKEKKNDLVNKSEQGLILDKGLKGLKEVKGIKGIEGLKGLDRLNGVNAGISCFTPDQLTKVQTARIDGFVERFDRKLSETRIRNGAMLVRGCIELIEILGREDFMYSAFLVKIKGELLRVEKSLMEGGGDDFSFGDVSNVFGKNGSERSYGKEVKIGGKTFSTSSSTLPNSKILKPQNFLIQSPESCISSYRSPHTPHTPATPPSPSNPPSLHLNIKPQTNSKSHSSTKQNPINSQSLNQELSHLKENNKKYELLITALKNRGYPIEEVYQFDVQNPVKSLESPQKLLKPVNLSLTSDESISEV